MRIAVIGSGISGLAAAYYLSRQHDVFVFERDSRIGGHTHTIPVDSSRGPIAVDTGFIVHNDRTYPNLINLFSELGVKTQPSDMSFAVACHATGFEYSSRGVNGFFAQRSNLFRPSHYRLLNEIVRFNREAPQLLARDAAEKATLGDVMDEGRYPALFTERYLYPMAAAVWSMSTSAIRSFPALTLLRFFHNHGLFAIRNHPQWKVLQGGSQAYLKPLTQPFARNITTGIEVTAVHRDPSRVTIDFRDRPAQQFDHVVFACHGNQILPLLATATDRERDVLSNFHTSRNEICLHTDESLLARRLNARASWNYHLEPGAPGATLTYHMNRLQSIPTPEQYCVTVNGNGRIDPAKVLRRIIYYHPLYTRPAIQAQARWPEISGQNRTHFCGAYWFYGFHEDGLNSARRVAQSLGIAC